LRLYVLIAQWGRGLDAALCLKAAGLPGLRFAAWEVLHNPGAREVVGSNPTDPTKRRTHPHLQPSLGELLSFGLWMRKEGYRESTIQSSVQALKSIARRANLVDPDSTKTYLASAKVSENRKSKLADDLARFYRYMQIHFEKPRYRRIDKIPFIPSQLEVDQLIAGVGKKMSAFLRLLSETGMRVGEAWNLRWADMDCERGVVNVTPEKGSNARQLKISSQLIAIVNQLPRKQPPFGNPDS
jgi:integrase